MTILHKVQFIGNITRDPEMRMLPNGSPVLSVSVAVNDSFISNGETKESVIYYDVQVYGDYAKKVEARHYQKGDQVLVEGRPELRVYKKRDESPGATISVRFPTISKVGGRSAEGSYRAAPAQNDGETSKTAIEKAFDLDAPEGEVKEDEMPF